MEQQNEPRSCINCSRELVRQKNAWICLKCNPQAIDTSDIFIDTVETEDFILIECPGASLYDPDTGEVTDGVRWRDENDATQGYDIIGKQIYAPNHNHRRRIRRDALGKIRRCRACQDYTIRMRRPEGRDFFIPSARHPRRDKLRPMEHVTYEPH